jgi:hypothetical protein
LRLGNYKIIEDSQSLSLIQGSSFFFNEFLVSLYRVLDEFSVLLDERLQGGLLDCLLRW